MFRLNLKFLDTILDRRRMLVRVAAAFAGLLVLGLGSGDGLDQLFRAARDGVRARPASGQVHIVEIDARSLQAIDRWPWPRRHHAELIDRLSAADARLIAFDVDFSSLSNPADDAALAAALRRAGGSVILPVLRQRESSQSSAHIDNTPAIPFRNNVFVASVNVAPDPDGYVRRLPLGLETDGVPRPSLAAIVAERQAGIDGSFDIDFAIDPASIPRHSFIDILEGRVAASELAGKRIIVGATAVEIWDRYAVPNHGIVPGVVIQALGAETLLRGPIPATAARFWTLLLALLLIAAATRPGNRTRRMVGFATGSGVIVALPLATEQWLALSFPLAPAAAALATAVAAGCTFHLAGRFRERSLTDPATGLPNLPALEAAADDSGTVVVAHIERFAAIASGLGPAATVKLIHRVADRLGFGDGRTIYRIDEGSLAWIETTEQAADLAERLEALIALMRSPVDCGRLIDVTLIFGVAEPIEGGSGQQVANASLAAVRAARKGRRWERFAEGESEETNWHLSLLGELDAAMAAGHVRNAYQPKLDIDSGRIIGAEALVRWEDPERGSIGPDDFIPLVEEHGRARDLTLHVLDEAVRDAIGWHAAGHDLAVAVNVSATLLLDESFVELLRHRLEQTMLPVDRLVIEVTESAAMKHPERAIAALESWRALGLSISIDDYGTGQSSLGYLQKLPANELKIDKSFVQTIAHDPRNAIMVRSTIAMAHELGMKVVAEGIEDAECLALLKEMGCDTAQGWHIGKPMPVDAFGDMLANRIRLAA
jgi:EAL domain-containing protein (putative c-di-GMP-specific phosphodiesterase class I)/CHASE2 domain-containing sensor protein